MAQPATLGQLLATRERLSDLEEGAEQARSRAQLAVMGMYALAVILGLFLFAAWQQIWVLQRRTQIVEVDAAAHAETERLRRERRGTQKLTVEERAHFLGDES